MNSASPADFIERGFGFYLLHGAEIASAASTFAISSRGIEIQINTRKAHRRKGLATIAGPALIVEALERDLDSCWNAANETSAGLR